MSVTGCLQQTDAEAMGMLSAVSAVTADGRFVRRMVCYGALGAPIQASEQRRQPRPTPRNHLKVRRQQ